jgi:hypothetical protein
VDPDGPARFGLVFPKSLEPIRRKRSESGQPGTDREKISVFYHVYRTAPVPA